MRFSTLVGAAAVVATISLAATAAQATPFVTGSFTIAATIASSENATDLPADTSLTLSPASTVTTTPESGSFSVIAVGEVLNTPTALNFGADTGFDFSHAADIGTFVASSATLVTSGHTGSGSGFATWEVDGSFTPGGLWDPSGTFGATEIWSCTQSGGAGHAISCSGTFSATRPSLPEPLTLSIFGAGLAGAAAIRRRRKARSVA